MDANKRKAATEIKPRFEVVEFPRSGLMRLTFHFGNYAPEVELTSEDARRLAIQILVPESRSKPIQVSAQDDDAEGNAS
jgi:hypothetical protein